MPRIVRLPLSITVALALAASICPAQDTFDLRRDLGQRPTPIATSPIASAPTTSATNVNVTPTAEMWFYEQERNRQDDPKIAIRRRAELRGQQRQDRLASLRYYGIFNSRPNVSPTPMYGGYSTHWSSNTYDPLRWRAVSTPLVVIRPAAGVVY